MIFSKLSAQCTWTIENELDCVPNINVSIELWCSGVLTYSSATVPIDFGFWENPSFNYLSADICDVCIDPPPNFITSAGCIIKIRINGMLLGNSEVFCCDNSVNPYNGPFSCSPNYCEEVEIDLCSKNIKIRKPDYCN